MVREMRAPLGKLVGRINLLFMAIVMFVTSTMYITGQSVGATSGQWGDTSISQIDGGQYLTCGVTDGRAFCWGMNTNGQLGNASTTYSPKPVAVDTSGVLAGKTVTKVVSGTWFACALAGGAAYCWGSGANGRLGNASTTGSSVPVAVDTSGVLAGKTVTDVTAGANHACAIADSKAYCWGGDLAGQLGTSSIADSSVPVAVDTSGVLAGKAIASISAGWSHTCAITEGKAYCWGFNDSGQLGNNSTTSSPVPVAVTASGVLAGKTVTAITAGDYHTCAIAGGQAYCWGNGDDGKLGNNSTIASSAPVAVNASGVLAGKTVAVITAGAKHTCAIADSKAYCWGNGDDGKLGNSLSTDSLVPVAVDTSAVLQNKSITSLSAGDLHTCAIADGQAYCWGYESIGELGTGSSIGGASSPIAVYVYQPPKITSVTFENDTYGKILVVQGESLFTSGNEAATQALTVGSIASLNDVPIAACAGGTLLTVLQSLPQIYNPAYYTTTPACYFIYDFDATAVQASPTELRIWVPDNFDVSAPGKVAVNTAPAFMFNAPVNEDTPTVPMDEEQPPTTPPVVTETSQTTTKLTTPPSVVNASPVSEVKDNIVSGVVSFTADSKTLIDNPSISSLPVFKGKAAPYSTVTVTVHSDPVTCTTKADGEGNWECQLSDKLPAGNHTVNIAMISPDNETTHLGPYPVHVASVAPTNDDTLPMAASQNEQKNGLPLWTIISAIAFVVIATWVAAAASRRRKA